MGPGGSAPPLTLGRPAETAVERVRGDTGTSLTHSAWLGGGEASTPASKTPVDPAEAAVEKRKGMAGRIAASSASESTSPKSPGRGAPWGPDTATTSSSVRNPETESGLAEPRRGTRVMPGPRSDAKGRAWAAVSEAFAQQAEVAFSAGRHSLGRSDREKARASGIASRSSDSSPIAEEELSSVQ